MHQMHQVMDLQPRQRLEARCSPEQVAFATVLALSTAEFEATVASEVDANPALERLEPACPLCGGVVGGPCCRPRGARPTSRDEPDGDLWEQIAAPVPLAEALLRDVAPLLPAGDAAVAEHVIASLDEHGLLDAPPDQIATRLGVGRGRVDGVVAALRSVTSPGAGACDIREHLLLEIDALDPGPVTVLARAIVADHLDALARGHVRRIATALGTEPSAVAEARDLIRRRLPAYPVLDAGRPHSPVSPPIAVPDLAMLAGEDGAVTVRVLEADRVRLRVSPAFERFARVGPAATRTGRPGAAPHAEDAERAVAWLGTARGFLDRIRRRWETMRAVGELAARRQHAFVTGGSGGLRPLTRAAVAAELGVHESTVGRAVKDRHVLLPSGRVVPFADFFPSTPGLAEELRRIVADEARPLSDAELAAELARRGHRVARRTVVKYRQRLGIANRAQRG